ncbi:MAG: PLP-dependent aminotransferase family protein [Desulfohalobiaceae bacterium]|nr:PLP-dependent aminotransferase family protein [Desulfohalobiaceae bacterium]
MIRTTQLNLGPEIIDLGVGQPSPSLLPFSLVKEAAENLFALSNGDFLAYGPEEGDGYFRASLAGFLTSSYQSPVQSDQLFVTGGASQTLDLICTLLTSSGDTIFCEDPTYFLSLKIFADHDLEVVGLPLDEQGLDVSALEEKLQQARPKFVYLIPTFHNPAGTTLCQERRKALVELAEKHGFFIVADEVYHLLSYGDPPPTAMAGWAGSGKVFSVGSFSKILAPGLRLGWIQTDPALWRHFAGRGLLQSGGGLSPFASAVVKEAIDLGLLERNRIFLQKVYGQRLRFLKKTVRDCLPQSEVFADPGGGFFLWLKFDPGTDCEQLLPRAREQGAGFLPGNRFSAHDSCPNFMRLSISYYPEPKLESGIQRLACLFEG